MFGACPLHRPAERQQRARPAAANPYPYAAPGIKTTLSRHRVSPTERRSTVPPAQAGSDFKQHRAAERLRVCEWRIPVPRNNVRTCGDGA